MRLLVIHDKERGEMGGMNDLIAAQNVLFRKAGWYIVEVVCSAEPQPDSLHLPASGRRSGRRAVHALRAMVEMERPDAVIAHSVYYALGPHALMVLQDMVPSIYLLHDVTPLCPRLTRLDREGRVCDRVQGLGCLSSGCYRVGEQGHVASDVWGLLMRSRQMSAAQSVQQWVVPSTYLSSLLEANGIPARRITVLPHFVDEARATLLSGNTRRPRRGQLLFAGRLIPEKGVLLLLDALTHLQYGDWSLLVAGEGPQAAELMQRVEARGWKARVRFAGKLGSGALADAYADAEVVVMPSLIPESFGLVGIEAMLAARPVAGFASGGMSEWLRDGVTGSVASWGDVRALATCIDRLFMQPETACAMGEQGRAIALREYTPDVHFGRMEALLQDRRANWKAGQVRP